jgi:hypothetical protein
MLCLAFDNLTTDVANGACSTPSNGHDRDPVNGPGRVRGR